LEVFDLEIYRRIFPIQVLTLEDNVNNALAYQLHFWCEDTSSEYFRHVPDSMSLGQVQGHDS